MAARERALIVGAGAGLSAAIARRCAGEGMDVVLAARDVQKLTALARETGATTVACDATNTDAVERLFTGLDASGECLDLVVYNASGRARGPIVELDPAAVDAAIRVTAFGGFLVARQAATRMLRQGHGTILFTGASASVKGYPRSSSFAMGKFALRGLAQSLARELQPHNIHVGHIVIDGGIAKAGDPRANERGPDGLLDPDAIAATYLNLHRQQRSAWAWEIELRPWVENF
ncbi:MAG TPA: SDR family NAD(P)-dependent oxidoreductase [Candidatus Dormibacteraeota bacterium]|nr:SDR family NAD(P)-dependent oxidoreductase [Candidatus Dormibacteraeota bacterium]HEX2680162.1 SDR family NAD(P)-dependent oxidoreductase [Candidatus Dormibacteraeota bacterium]